MWQVIVKGGPVMIPIILCSFAGLAIIIERAIYLYNHRFKLKENWPAVQRLISGGHLEEGIKIVDQTGGLGADLIKAAILSIGRQREELVRNMEVSARKEFEAMNRGLFWLEVIVTIAPLLGLLGTVTGIIDSFQILSVSIVSDANALSAGIAEALITTAAGLIVAVPSYVMYSYFQSFINKQAGILNNLGDEILSLTGELK